MVLEAAGLVPGEVHLQPNIIDVILREAPELARGNLTFDLKEEPAARKSRPPGAFRRFRASVVNTNGTSLSFHAPSGRSAR
jgi:hypothetical protein